MEKLVYAVWLHSCLGTAYPRIRNVFGQFDDAEHVFRSDERELKLSGAFTPKTLQRLLKKNTDFAKRILERCNELGHDILLYSDKDYPDSLRTIELPPLLLFVSGRIPKHEGLKVAVVGTRKATRLGKQVSFEFGYNLTKNNALVVSGGAEGIDTAAHSGALHAGGNTVCVLGCGMCHKYLMVNARMRDQISKHGAVISEFMPDDSAASYTFPRRNRIISALTDCTLVVEAGENSGSLITAGDAAEQRKAIFAVPGSVDNVRSAGSNRLLAAGAKAAINYMDILNWYRSEYSTFVQKLKKEDIDVIRMNNRTEKDITKLTPEVALGAMERLPDRPSIKADPPALPQNNNTAISESEESSVIKIQKPKKTDNIFKELLTETAKTVYDTISEAPSEPEEISQKTGLDISEVLSALTELEINNIVELSGFGKYKRK